MASEPSASGAMSVESENGECILLQLRMASGEAVGGEGYQHMLQPGRLVVVAAHSLDRACAARPPPTHALMAREGLLYELDRSGELGRLTYSSNGPSCFECRCSS